MARLEYALGLGSSIWVHDSGRRMDDGEYGFGCVYMVRLKVVVNRSVHRKLQSYPVLCEAITNVGCVKGVDVKC